LKIEGQRVILRDDHRDSDSDDFFRWFNMEEWKYYDQPDRPFQPISREEFDKRARRNREEYDKRSKEQPEGSSSSRPSPGWHIDTVDGQHIGWVNYYNWDQEQKSAFIGICIPEEENWGKGYGTEAVSLFLNFLFDSSGLETIRAATWTGNSRMVRCAQKAGFTNQEIMPHRSSISVRGEPLERIEFSLSSAEWYRANRDGG
jgi:RimJ/RimL family protein N-acetyltransferase